MLLSSFFVVSDAQTAPLQIILDKVALTSYTTEVSFENGFKDTSPSKKYTLMMLMADADDTPMFYFFQHNT